MMYEVLAKFYDALVKDDQATMDWVTFICKHIEKGSILELACGSGEITIALANLGYQICASDRSIEMLAEAKRKEGSDTITWRCMDMCCIEDHHCYDGILCLCDSFNYILQIDQVTHFFQSMYNHLHAGGKFIMDMHSMERLVEFQEEYNETGTIQNQPYQWTIYSEGDRIYQTFAFYDEQGNSKLEQHVQRVYDPMLIKEILTQVGFSVTVYTDFVHEGIVAGEKQFFVCRR